MSDDIQISEITMNEDIDIIPPIDETEEVPFMIYKDMMILMILKYKQKEPETIIGIITNIQRENETEDIATLQISETVSKLFLVTNNELITKTEVYEILDCESIIPFDSKQITKDVSKYLTKDIYSDIELETEVLEEKHKQYSIYQKTNDLLSHLIKAYDAINNKKKLKEIQLIIESIIILITNKLTYVDSNVIPDIINNKYIFPSRLIPFTDQTTKEYDDTRLNEEIQEQIEIKETNDYRTGVQNDIEYSSIFTNEDLEGFTTTDYSGNYLLHKQQLRKTRHKLVLPLFEGQYELYSSDKITFDGFIEEPQNHYSLSLQSVIHNQELSLYEKILFSYLYSFNNSFQQYPYINHYSDITTLPPDKFDSHILHLFQGNISNSDIQQIMIQNTITSDLLLQELDETIKTKLLNINDLHYVFMKYNIKFCDFSKDTRDIICSLLEDNCKNYITNYNKSVKQRKIKPLPVTKGVLTTEMKIDLIYEYIFHITDIETRRDLLKRFIDIYTRPSESKEEDHLFLYNKHTDKKILCRHYLYETQITNTNSMFQTLRDKFGSSPVDGNIYCKVCNEFICPEDFSLLEGFSDDKPSRTREKLQSDDTTIKDFLEEKDTIVNLITLLSHSLGAELTEEDIYQIILSFEMINHDVLADERYKLTGISDSDAHPRVKQIIQSSKKKKKKKDKEETNDKQTTELQLQRFQQFIKYSNEILGLLSIISIFIQTAIPAYTLRKDITNELLPVNDMIHETTIHKPSIAFLLKKIKKLSEKYPDTIIWSSIQQLFIDEHDTAIDVLSSNEQLLHTILYIISPRFSLITKRIQKYRVYMDDISKNYMKQEWPIFKPLQNNIFIQTTNDITQKNIMNKYLIHSYNGYPIENIAFIRDIYDTRDIYQLIDIPSFELMKNQSFKRLFKYVISCHGNQKETPMINLLIQRLIITTSDKVETIFSKYGWNKQTKTLSKLSFQTLRQSVIPSIIELYQKDTSSKLESCYHQSTSCNDYIHISINNCDLHLINTLPRRHYSYKPMNVIPSQTYDQLQQDNPKLLDKLFSTYYKDDITHEIIHLQINKDNISSYETYIHTLLSRVIQDNTIDNLQTNELLHISPIKRNKEGFHYIIQTIHSNNKLNHNESYISNLLQPDYKSNQFLLQMINSRILSYYQELPMDTNIHIKSLNEKGKDLFENYAQDIYSNRYLTKDSMDKHQEGISSFRSSLIKTTNDLIKEISIFLLQNKSITSSQIKRFESIFKTTDKSLVDTSIQIERNLDYNHYIQQLLKDKHMTSDIMRSYIHNIKSTLSLLSENETEFIVSGHKMPKHWNLSESHKQTMEDYIDHKKYVLHNQKFVQSRDTYIGFKTYIDMDSHPYISELYNYLDPYFKHIDLLRGSDNQLFDSKTELRYMKYILITILYKIVEYITYLQIKDSPELDANQLFTSLEERDSVFTEESSKVCSMLLMDFITNIFYTHYDPSWIAANIDTSHLSTRLSKQKEREKQSLVETLDNSNSDERYIRMEKQKAGLSNWWADQSNKASEYVSSQEYLNDTEDERRERLQDIFQESQLQVESLNQAKNNNEIQPIPLPNIQPVQEEEEGYYDSEDMNEDNEENMYEEHDYQDGDNI